MHSRFRKFSLVAYASKPPSSAKPCLHVGQPQTIKELITRLYLPVSPVVNNHGEPLRRRPRRLWYPTSTMSFWLDHANDERVLTCFRSRPPRSCPHAALPKQWPLQQTAHDRILSDAYTLQRLKHNRRISHILRSHASPKPISRRGTPTKNRVARGFPTHPKRECPVQT